MIPKKGEPQLCISGTIYSMLSGQENLIGDDKDYRLAFLICYPWFSLPSGRANCCVGQKS